MNSPPSAHMLSTCFWIVFGDRSDAASCSRKGRNSTANCSPGGRSFSNPNRFFRSFDPLPFDGRLLARPRNKQTLVKQLRSYLPDVVAAVGITTRIVPPQLRHTYASEMVRAGVGLPALMKLLGHVNPEMTMRYVDVVGTDLQREFHLARSQPRHLVPQLKSPSFSPRGGLDGVVDSLLFAQHAIKMFRRSLPNGAPKHRLNQLANRLSKILTETRKLNPAG
jgi:hypothetical protein